MKIQLKSNPLIRTVPYLQCTIYRMNRPSFPRVKRITPSRWLRRTRTSWDLRSWPNLNLSRSDLKSVPSTTPSCVNTKKQLMRDQDTWFRASLHACKCVVINSQKARQVRPSRWMSMTIQEKFCPSKSGKKFRWKRTLSTRTWWIYQNRKSTMSFIKGGEIMYFSIKISTFINQLATKAHGAWLGSRSSIWNLFRLVKRFNLRLLDLWLFGRKVSRRCICWTQLEELDKV